MGNNIEGFANENKLIDYINGSEIFDNYNSNIKNLLMFVFDFDLVGKKIICQKMSGQQKPDLSFTCNGIIKYISIKKDLGNSIHQENFSLFIKFLNEISISKETINNIKLFHYGDDTLDDTGNIRYSALECSIRYKKQIELINMELNQREILSKIIKRILFLGNTKECHLVDVIYYGTLDNGIWASRNELYNYFLNNKFNSNSIHFASLTYQVWGRNNNFTAKNPSRRYIMQVKWAWIATDIFIIRRENI